MSFDLQYCLERAETWDPQRALDVLRKLPFMEESQTNDGELIQFCYENPATGVYCIFDLSSDRPEPMESPNECFSTIGFSVNINFLRPHFFALEVMPVIARVAAALQLSIYDPQEEQLLAPSLSPATIISSWIKHNEWATRTLAAAENPVRKPYLSPSQAAYWWRYMYSRDQYQISLEEDVFFPSILLMLDEAGQVNRVVLWAAEFIDGDLVPIVQVFPECEFLLLATKDPATGSTEYALSPFTEALESLGLLVTPIDGSVSRWVKLRARQVQDSGTVFLNLRRLPFEGFSQIASDGFVDVDIRTEIQV